ncbi:unnamed protein product [Ixodes persulcatus]
MGSSESDGAQQQQSMFKVKGLTLIKEAVNGLVKSSPRKEPTDFPETTLISLTSLKSRVVAALTAQGGSSLVSGANSCSRSLRSRPSTSQATDSCAAQGPKRSATAMTAHSEPPLLLKKPKLERATDFPETTLISLTSLKSRVVAALTAQGGSSLVSGANSCSRSLLSPPSTSRATDSCAAQGPKRSATAMTAHSEPPLLLKQPKLEREQSPDPRPAESSPSCPEQAARGKQSLRSRKRYFGAGVSSKSSPHANAASSTYGSPATPVYMKVEPLEELPQPQEASLPCHSAEVSPPSSMPKSLPGTSPVKVEPADAPSGLWDIPPKLWEDMQSVLFTHLDST